MAASKSLILLKGIGGLAATSLATLGGMEVGYKLQSSKTVGTAHSDDISLDIESEPEEYIEKVSDLGIPSGCDASCELTAEQLRNLKLESKSDTSVIFDGLIDSDTFELAIEDSEDSANYPWGKKYTLKSKTTTSETITIKGLKGDDIVLEKEQGIEIREKEEGGKLEKVPEEVNNLGIPKRCEGEQEEDQTAQTCELTREQLQRLKFETRDEETSITVSGLKDNNTVTLTIEKVSGDSDNYPHEKKYTLKSTTGTVTIKGVKDGDIVLEANQGVDFREKQDDSKLLETVENSLGIPRRCTPETEKCELTKEELQRLKFETESGSPIEVDGLADGEKVELKIETTSDLTNYPKGKKYILTSTDEDVTIKGLKSGDIVLEAEQEGVVIRETSSGGRLEKGPEEVNELGIPKNCTTDSETPCELTKDQLQRFKFEPKGNEEITVEGLTGNNTVTLEIGDKKDDRTNYPHGKKYTLTSSKDDVTIKGVKDGDITITKEKEQGVLIRETGRGGKLEEVPEEVDRLGIPKSCTPRESCQLTKEQLQRLKFEAKSSSSISITGLGSNDTVDLKVEDSNDRTNYPKGKKYTLTSKAGKVTIKGLRGGDIDLGANQGVVIREKHDGGLLEKGPEEVDSLGIPTSCTAGSTCELTRDQLKKIKFEPKDSKSSVFISGLGTSYKVELKVEESNDSTNYPKRKKYSFKAKRDGVTIKNTKNWDIDLEKDKEVLIREKQNGGQLETVEDSLGIPKSCKANEVKKFSNPQTCQLTADQLKNLKLRAFGGKNAHAKVTGLNDTIKLTISWVEDGSSYPGNIKYSFDNTSKKDEDIRISKDGQTVTIEKQKESWFKNNGGQLELVEANTKSQVKMKEANEILRKLGLFEKLEMKTEKDFTDIYSAQHKQKEANFTRIDDLKKIQFKELGGGAENTNPPNLSGKKITVFFEWDWNTNKFPKNMKFSFENQNFTPNFEFKKGKSSVQIFKKHTSTNKDNINNRFKVVNDQDKWYLVRSN